MGLKTALKTVYTGGGSHMLHSTAFLSDDFIRHRFTSKAQNRSCEDVKIFFQQARTAWNSDKHDVSFLKIKQDVLHVEFECLLLCSADRVFRKYIFL